MAPAVATTTPAITTGSASNLEYSTLGSRLLARRNAPVVEHDKDKMIIAIQWVQAGIMFSFELSTPRPTGVFNLSTQNKICSVSRLWLSVLYLPPAPDSE
jgi:hypothetical protein